MKEIPKWLCHLVDKNGLEKIRSSVVQAEGKTSAELVPMIVRSSIMTGHVSWIVFLMTLLLSWILIPYLVHLAPHWVWDIAAVALAAALAVALSRLDFVRRWLTSAADEALAAERRAVLEFHLSDIKNTEGKTGVLIFVSLLERKVVILADHAISSQFPPETWQNAVTGLVAKIKSGRFSDGMSETITEIGRLLEARLPLRPGDRNELADHLIVKE